MSWPIKEVNNEVRGLFLLLLLTNLAFTAWRYSQRDEESGSVDIYRGITTVKEGLALIRELPPEQKPRLREDADERKEQLQKREGGAQPSTVVSKDAVAATTPQVAGGAPSHVCLQMSGIDELQERERILRVLRQHGATSIAQAQARVMRTNYRVFLPPYPNRAKATEAAAILAARGVSDYFIVRSGDNENALSLGVFSTQERAERRSRQIMGLNARLRTPKIASVPLPAVQYTVSYQVAGEESLLKLQRRLQEMKAPSVEEISCK